MYLTDLSDALNVLLFNSSRLLKKQVLQCHDSVRLKVPNRKDYVAVILLKFEFRQAYAIYPRFASFAYERPIDASSVLFAEKRMIRITRMAGMIVRNLRWGPCTTAAYTGAVNTIYYYIAYATRAP